jgi:hypothetical protein
MNSRLTSGPGLFALVYPHWDPRFSSLNLDHSLQLALDYRSGLPVELLTLVYSLWTFRTGVFASDYWTNRYGTRSGLLYLDDSLGLLWTTRLEFPLGLQLGLLVWVSGSDELLRTSR